MPAAGQLQVRGGVELVMLGSRPDLILMGIIFNRARLLNLGRGPCLLRSHSTQTSPPGVARPRLRLNLHAICSYSGLRPSAGASPLSTRSKLLILI